MGGSCESGFQALPTGPGQVKAAFFVASCTSGDVGARCAGLRHHRSMEVKAVCVCVCVRWGGGAEEGEGQGGTAQETTK